MSAASRFARSNDGSVGYPVRPGSRIGCHQQAGGVPWDATSSNLENRFEVMSKRRRGFHSETHVKRGQRVVHGDKELVEKLGRNDLCPCDSGRRFQEMLHE